MPLRYADGDAVTSCHGTLAFASVLREAGYSPHRYLWVSATDIEPLAAGMAYIQLSLCGVAGEVVVSNSLNDERRRVLYTFGHYQGNWSSRFPESGRLNHFKSSRRPGAFVLWFLFAQRIFLQMTECTFQRGKFHCFLT